MRGTIDIDIYRQVAVEISFRDLMAAIQLDLGDWFEYEIDREHKIAQIGGNIEVPIRSRIGGADWVKFHLDLLGGAMHMSGAPDLVPALALGLMPTMEQSGYRAYPLVDHVSDKISAIIERYGPDKNASSRYKDLVDLVALVTSVSIAAEPVRVALALRAADRGTELPTQFSVPDRQLWEEGYRKLATSSILPIARNLDEALVVTVPFVNPILDGTAHGVWDPRRLVFTSDAVEIEIMNVADGLTEETASVINTRIERFRASGLGRGEIGTFQPGSSARTADGPTPEI